MSNTPPIATPEINKAKNAPPHEIKINCAQLWSLAQAQAIRRLSTQRKEYYPFGSKKWMLVSDFSTRAARIAGVYASFYLEKEDGGQVAFKGRFYWMGLAAFASKQVMCGLNFTRIVDAAPKKPVLIPAKVLNHIGKNGLGKGNFWLFQDIFCWHWFYSKFPDSFFSCKSARNSDTFEKPIADAVKKLPWSEESLPAINNLKVTPEVSSAFELIKETEALTGEERAKKQYKSLLAIANHEQLNILQKLIYNDWSFQKTLDAQKLAEGAPLVPLRSAAFSTLCDLDDPDLREQMHDGKLYHAQQRMDFIVKIADKYHNLMRKKKSYMEGEIASIASWKNIE
ncbi:hypothetical protein RBU55_14950 [Pseudomonas chlororaphis subsp. aurantiaca]|uniref:DUF2515 family protein n=1 Tax=Pseudomonas chlororaphis TaxID=587753 RepID=UPI0027DDD410|nr:hypothetical protein [Pseudomonas chlororaphis]WMJ02813.1 hypothetical protein RBU55_14950 [Pseudomonas chlororaphis subsp. aurantiaca]